VTDGLSHWWCSNRSASKWWKFCRRTPRGPTWELRDAPAITCLDCLYRWMEDKYFKQNFSYECKIAWESTGDMP